MSKIIRIELPTPALGGKAWLLDAKGMFILEKGPGMLITIACTHAGSGSMAAFDGIPDEDGFFQDERMKDNHPDFEKRNGRPIYRATPTVMGSWMLNGGFYHGLTIKATGGVDSAAAVASIVWMAHKTRQ
jgi:hypothetical protein